MLRKNQSFFERIFTHHPTLHRSKCLFFYNFTILHSSHFFFVFFLLCCESRSIEYCYYLSSPAHILSISFTGFTPVGGVGDFQPFSYSARLTEQLGSNLFILPGSFVLGRHFRDLEYFPLAIFGASTLAFLRWFSRKKVLWGDPS